MSAIDPNDFWAACMTQNARPATDQASLWGSTTETVVPSAAEAAAASLRPTNRQLGDDDAYLQDLQQKLNSVLLSETTNSYQQSRTSTTPPSSNPSNYPNQPSFTVVSGEQNNEVPPPPPFGHHQQQQQQASAGNANGPQPYAGTTSHAQLQAAAASATTGGMQFQVQQGGVMGGAPVAMVLMPGTNQLMMLPQGAIPMMVPQQHAGSGGGGFVMPSFAPQFFQQHAMAHHPNQNAAALMPPPPRGGTSNGGAARSGNRQRSSNQHQRNQQHQLQQQQQQQFQQAMLQSGGGSVFPMFPMAPVVSGGVGGGASPTTTPPSTLQQMQHAASALAQGTQLIGMMNPLPQDSGALSESNEGSPNTSPASLQHSLRGQQLPSVPREPGNRPNHSTNVHDALAGKCQFHAYRIEPSRKPPPAATTGAAEQTLPIFVQMFPSEWIQHAQPIFQEIIRCICGASPDGKGDGVVESMDRRSETSFIVHVRTSHVWDLISNLRCRVLMDRHGFWYAHQWSTYVDMKEYCESVRKMPQQQRHYKTDGLPCMPLVVELGRTVAPDTVILAPTPTSVPFDTLMPMTSNAHHGAAGDAGPHGGGGPSGGSHSHHHGRGNRRHHNNNASSTHGGQQQLPGMLSVHFGNLGQQHTPADHRARGRQVPLLF